MNTKKIYEVSCWLATGGRKHAPITTLFSFEPTRQEIVNVLKRTVTLSEAAIDRVLGGDYLVLPKILNER